MYRNADMHFSYRPLNAYRTRLLLLALVISFCEWHEHTAAELFGDEKLIVCLCARQKCCVFVIVGRPAAAAASSTAVASHCCCELRANALAFDAINAILEMWWTIFSKRFKIVLTCYGTGRKRVCVHGFC